MEKFFFLNKAAQLHPFHRNNPFLSMLNLEYIDHEVNDNLQVSINLFFS